MLIISSLTFRLVFELLKLIAFLYALVIARFRVQYANIFRVSHILPTYFMSL